ncbi:hypothetical protein FRC11_011819, partial [Ceratobasidium sp. 423]
GHTDAVFSVKFSPDGTSVASGSQDGTIRIWDADNPHPIGEPWKEHAEEIRSVSYSPLGNMLVSGSDDRTIRLWDTGTGQQIGEPLKGHRDIVRSVAFSPSADLIASCSKDNAVRLWDTKRTSTSRPFKGHAADVSSVVFPSNTCVVSGAFDMKIRVWDVIRGTTVVGPLRGHTSYVLSVDVSPDGSHIVSGSTDFSLRFWDIRSGTMTRMKDGAHIGDIWSVSFSPDGKYVASGGFDRAVRLWDLRTGHQVDEPFAEHNDTVRSVAFSPCGTRIASGSDDNRIIVWRLSESTSHIEHNPYAMVGGEAKQFVVQTGSLEVRPKQFEVEIDTEAIHRDLSIHEMFDLLSRHGCANLTSKINANQDTAILVSRGGFGDIWQATQPDGTQVAIKTWRESLIGQHDYKLLKRGMREIYYWSKMKHENVHQLMGVIMFNGQSIGMVSEWMENGNLHEYLRKTPSANRLELVHGDLKALNILVSSEGVAKLTDFGLSTMSESSIKFSENSTSHAGSTRWAAPELLLGGSPKSKDSDIYALGMTILEIFTGNVPYHEIRRDYLIIRMVDQGLHPTCPTDELEDYDKYNGWLWEILVSCWDRDPDARPSAEQIVEW